MTKQEEIREGMALIFESQCWVSDSLDMADKTLTYLHSQGVVIKVAQKYPLQPHFIYEPLIGEG